ncbi:hypothetical protein AGDE_13757 [Angomonas deanei]|uniref:Uncharacterized protein n=1 Tax=Angomonas deanei TaxID=59799 RepID=A0A7G2CRX7_9TRYP|nr:hypothetical protein AGDE_13757 [Angomonas deanei]CAD2221751.1 hypothetical protein, conserved [Angomonas deanei]|eukprot:EPY21841.1 hypothetical protein AGDE_13757 [Angomonas deanei]
MQKDEPTLNRELAEAIRSLLASYGVTMGEVNLHLGRPRPPTHHSTSRGDSPPEPNPISNSTSILVKSTRADSPTRADTGSSSSAVVVSVHWADSFTPLAGGLAVTLPQCYSRPTSPDTEEEPLQRMSPMTHSLQSATSPMSGKLRPQQVVRDGDGSRPSSRLRSSGLLPDGTGDSRLGSPVTQELRLGKGARPTSVRFPAESPAAAPPRASRRRENSAKGVRSRRPVFSILNTNKEDGGLSRSNISVRVDEGADPRSPVHEPLLGSRAEQEASRQRGILLSASQPRSFSTALSEDSTRGGQSFAFSDSGSFRPASSSGQDRPLGLPTFSRNAPSPGDVHAITVEGKGLRGPGLVSPPKTRNPRPSLVSEKGASTNGINKQ